MKEPDFYSIAKCKYSLGHVLLRGHAVFHGAVTSAEKSHLLGPASENACQLFQLLLIGQEQQEENRNENLNYKGLCVDDKP